MEKYEVYENEPVMFHNRAFSCIGTGRMDLALHKETFLSSCVPTTSIRRRRWNR